jgi:isoprenylcysteine carboxyl methyltransferase (ICMT) family protein YpbQ
VDKLLAELPVVCVLLATALVYYGEKRVHGYNYDFLKAVSGEELIPKPMNSYYTWAYLFPWLCFLSARAAPPSMQLAASPYLGLAAVILGIGLRLWVMRALGRLWSHRCIFVAGMPRVAHGPYRFLRHPEYTGRAMEGLGYLLFFGFNPIAAGLWVYLQLLVARITKTESRQLYELSVAPLQLQEGSSTVGSSE